MGAGHKIFASGLDPSGILWESVPVSTFDKAAGLRCFPFIAVPLRCPLDLKYLKTSATLTKQDERELMGLQAVAVPGTKCGFPDPWPRVHIAQFGASGSNRCHIAAWAAKTRTQLSASGFDGSVTHSPGVEEKPY